MIVEEKFPIKKFQEENCQGIDLLQSLKDNHLKYVLRYVWYSWTKFLVNMGCV